MANKALKLRLKAEARELEHPTCRYPARTQDAARANATAAAMPSHDNLLPVPPSKALLAGFPPTCSVLYTDTSVTPNISIKGIVKTVFIDLSPGSNREYFYQVGRGGEGKSIIARESHLQWAHNSPVWVRLQYENPDSNIKRACTIAGCYKQDMSTLYSVQEVTPGTCLFHGVTMDCIQFRLENDITAQHVEPSTSATAAATNGATHHVARATASTNSASKASVPMPIMPVSSTPVVKKHDESVVPRVTGSPRKRSITEVAHHELHGCSAEFELPRWMKALCLDDDFQHQICSFVQDCSDCRATILESLNRDSEKMGHSIFVYGKDSTVVEQAIAAVSDLLQEYVSKDDKKRLAAELQTGWKRNKDEDVDKSPVVFGEEEGKSSSYSNVPRATKSTVPKKARSRSEEGELRSAGSDSTTKVLFRSQSNTCPPVQLASEKDIQAQSALSLQPVAPSGQEELDTASPAEDEYPGLVKRIIKVPLFANDSLIKEALVGPDDQIREYLFGETGCDIILTFPDGSLLDPIEVVLTGAFDDGDFDFAQRWVENRIVSTVAEDEKGRMLFSLAKENSYGASEGHARYQRSPYDLKTWVWMNVVEVPDGFQPCVGLFIDKKGKAIKDMIRSTKCSDIQLVDTLPLHIFLSSASLDAVLTATEAVKDRVLWALNEYKQRKYGSKKKKW